MSAIRSTNTKPEVFVRKSLHRDGFRFRLHARTLPGTPDIVLPRYRSVVLVNGCFWHVHECAKFRWPRTRAEFWCEKLLANRARDVANIGALTASGWRVAVVWECALTPAVRANETAFLLSQWIRSGNANLELDGTSG